MSCYCLGPQRSDDGFFVEDGGDRRSVEEQIRVPVHIYGCALEVSRVINPETDVEDSFTRIKNVCFTKGLSIISINVG